MLPELFKFRFESGFLKLGQFVGRQTSGLLMPLDLLAAGQGDRLDSSAGCNYSSVAHTLPQHLGLSNWRFVALLHA